MNYHILWDILNFVWDSYLYRSDDRPFNLMVVDNLPSIWYLCPDSIYRCCLTSIWNQTVAIRRSYDCLISTMGFLILVRWLYIDSGPCAFTNTMVTGMMLVSAHFLSVFQLCNGNSYAFWPQLQGMGGLAVSLLMEFRLDLLGSLVMVSHLLRPIMLGYQRQFSANSNSNTGLMLGLQPANEKRRYKVTPSLIGWAQN